MCIRDRYRTAAAFHIHAGYKDMTIVLNVDLDAAVSGDLLDHLAARTDYFTDLLGVDHQGEHLGSILAQLRTYFRNGLEPVSYTHLLSAEIGRPTLTAEQPVQAVRESDIVSRLGNAILLALSLIQILQYAPADRLLIETDCPYMAPEPLRGRRCDSTMLQYTLARMAELKGLTPEEMAAITWKNACTVYGLPE